MAGIIAAAITFVVAFGLLLLVILLPVSVKTVANDEMALKYNTVSRHFSRTQTPYEQGRYVLQPGENFFRFKRVFVLEALDGTDCLTQDGLHLVVDITFQYKIRSAQLIDLFSLLGSDYQNVIILQASAAVRDACGAWTSNDFYYHRQNVQTDMGTRVDARLAQVFCDGGFLQLVNVQFDTSFIAAVQATQSAIQDITQAGNERQQALIKAQTEVLQSQQYADITITNAKAQAEITLANANAQARSINATLDAQRSAYLALGTTLGLTGEGLINYIAIQATQNSQSITIAVDPPAAFSYP